MLAGLDRPHQSFFTANESRTKHFYDLWVSTNQVHTRPFQSFRDTGYQRMLRSVPLDEDGHVEFPGSPEVWTVAKGHSSDQEHTAHLLKKVRKAATPDFEDAVLARLADTKYKESRVRLSELDNFLAVSSVDAHRVQPMDEESALMLAQKYADNAALFPYLTDLRALTAKDYATFFSAFEHIANHPAQEANLQYGQLHGLTEWICLLVQRRLIKDEDAAELVRKMASSFAAAEDGASYTSAALDSARAILSACNKDVAASPDQALQSCLLGRHAAASDERLKSFVRILDAQHVPSLADLLAIQVAAASISTSKSVSASLEIIQKSVDALPSVGLPKEAKVQGKDKSEILRYDPAPARKLLAEMKEKAGKRKPNLNDLQKLTRELLAELQPEVCAAIVGPIYAYFLRASDVVVMDDPLLLRKHHYFDFSESSEHSRLPTSDFKPGSEGEGSYFLGGFGQFPFVASLASAHRRILARPWRAWQLNWPLFAALNQYESTSTQHVASMRIVVAREWIYESAANPDLFHTLNYQKRLNKF